MLTGNNTIYCQLEAHIPAISPIFVPPTHPTPTTIHTVPRRSPISLSLHSNNSDHALPQCSPMLSEIRGMNMCLLHSWQSKTMSRIGGDTITTRTSIKSPRMSMWRWFGALWCKARTMISAAHWRNTIHLPSPTLNSSTCFGRRANSAIITQYPDVITTSLRLLTIHRLCSALRHKAIISTALRPTRA